MWLSRLILAAGVTCTGQMRRFQECKVSGWVVRLRRALITEAVKGMLQLECQRFLTPRLHTGRESTYQHARECGGPFMFTKRRISVTKAETDIGLHCFR